MIFGYGLKRKALRTPEKSINRKTFQPSNWTPKHIFQNLPNNSCFDSRTHQRHLGDQAIRSALQELCSCATNDPRAPDLRTLASGLGNFSCSKLFCKFCMFCSADFYGGFGVCWWIKNDKNSVFCCSSGDLV